MNPYLKNLNRIEFIITMACTGHCKHCSEGNHSSHGQCINTDAAVQAIYEICALYPIKSLMTFGGEPLLYPEAVCRIHEAAQKMNIPQRDVITNGYFSKDEKRIEEVAHMLSISGVKDILLSVDAFHQETIPLDPVMYFAECIKKETIGIRLSPAWLVSMDDNNPYNCETRNILRKFESLSIPVGSGNIIFPCGNAKKYLGDYFDPDTDYTNPYEDDPKDIRAISFDCDGSVLNGNIINNRITDIIKQYTPD